MTNKFSRKDISTLDVLSAYERRKLRGEPFVELILSEKTGAPIKVCFSAMEREADRGFVEYGVSLRTGWLTPEGVEELRKLRGPKMHKHIDEATPEQKFEQENYMREIMSTLDYFFNGEARGEDRKVGIVLLTYPFGDNPDALVNYIGNGERAGVLKALKDLVARWETAGA